MTREQAIEQLKECQLNDDAEIAHRYADAVLCDLLRALGYKDVVDEWVKIGKWYS